jgi:ligand-binding sensor domain-containing protein
MLLSLATGGHAQAPEWVVYNTDNSELPGNEVIELAFDPAEALWIGTRSDGLARFDGETWTVYNMANSQLQSNTIPALAFDAQGELWIGTGDGLGLFDGKNWYVFTTESTDLPYDAIHALAVDAGGELWIGTGNFYGEGGGGLAKFDKKIFKWARKESFMMYNTKNSDLPGDQILSLAIDARGRLWVGTATGKVARFDGNTWTVYTSDNPGRPWGPVPALVCDAQGTTWIGTDGGGVARFDGTNWTVYSTRNSGLPNNNVHALALDPQGNIWVGTERGVAKFDGEVWSVFTPDNSGLPDYWIWALTLDIQDNLWIGTMSGGVAVYREGGVLSPEKATRVEDLVGIWEGWYMGSVAYRQFEADGTLKCAAKVEWLEDSSRLTYSGKFWFEGEILKITASGQPATGVYEVWVRKKDGKTVHLSFHDMGDLDHLRAYDWGRGMTRVEP